MPFKRQKTPLISLHGEALTAAMASIGMNFAAPPTAEANIEDTLLAASVEALTQGDLRTLALLTTWLGIHSARVNVDRLRSLIAVQESERVRAYWAAVGTWLAKDRRVLVLARLYRGERIDLLPVGTDFQVRRFGEDPRFAAGPLRVPANVLRERPVDVMPPAALAKRHRAYRQRVLMGPTYRADMWAALERDPSLSPAELARRSYGSFATAWQVKHDFTLLVA